MCLSRGLHPDAHVRSLRVVEVYNPVQNRPAFISGDYGHLIQPFDFQDAVGPFRDSVLKRVSALGHADAYPALFQFGHILVAAVLFFNTSHYLTSPTSKTGLSSSSNR